MAHWMCTTCGYYLQISDPPNKCPSCEQTCVFTNVTCYRPGCEEQIDPVLMGNTLKLLKGVSAPETKMKPTLPSSEDIQLVDILNGLDEEQRRQFESLGSIENYDTGRAIFAEGAEARRLYIMERGQVAVTTQLVGRVRLPISIITPGYAFGWSALVTPYRYTASATAVFKARVLAFEREALLSMMHANPLLGLTVMQNIASTVASRLRTVEMVLAGMLR
jgi:CRP/FNR family cyclic AMP-dependent transcriptional regulator